MHLTFYIFSPLKLDPRMIDLDVYEHIKYGDFTDELKLADVEKCLLWSLIQLLGEKCRERTCSAALETESVHAIACGYCVKLVWKCEDGHVGNWYSSPICGSGFGINYLVNTRFSCLVVESLSFIAFVISSTSYMTASTGTHYIQYELGCGSLAAVISCMCTCTKYYMYVAG